MTYNLQNLCTQQLFDLSHTLANNYLLQYKYPWDAISGISKLILSLGEKLGEGYIKISADVWIHKTAKVAQTAAICGPCIIGADTQIRHCAFIRSSALVGDNCVVGNSVELKNVILFDNVQVPHFNYVGDSILGYKAHMGAGSITSNVKCDKTEVTIKNCQTKIYTGLKKFGAILGDNVEVGCNAVLNPGTIVGKNTSIYPLSCVRGVVPADGILKSDGAFIKKNNSH